MDKESRFAALARLFGFGPKQSVSADQPTQAEPRYSEPDKNGVVFDRETGRFVVQPAQEHARGEQSEEEDEPGEPARTAFDDFMDERADPQGAKWMNARIAGVTHRNEDGSSRQARIRELKPMEALALARDPDNPFSKSAVKVLNATGEQLGFLPQSLAWEVADAIDSGGTAEAFVRHVRPSGTTNKGVAIGVLWRVKLSPRNEFRRMLDARMDVEEWFWAKLSGLESRDDSEEDRQGLIATLQPHDRLMLVASMKVSLIESLGRTVATLSKQQGEMVLLGMRDGRSYEAIVFEVRPRAKTTGLEPVVAILLMK